jgi:hypothetical protein
VGPQRGQSIRDANVFSRGGAEMIAGQSRHFFQTLLRHRFDSPQNHDVDTRGGVGKSNPQCAVGEIIGSAG